MKRLFSPGATPWDYARAALSVAIACVVTYWMPESEFLLANPETLTISMITNEALVVLENNLKGALTINRQFDKSFGVGGAKIGTTLNVRKPVRYTVSSGQALDLQSPVETQVSLVLDKQKHVDFQFSSSELLLSVDEFSDRFLKPAIAALANQIDQDVLAETIGIPYAVGTPGTTPNALLTYLQTAQKLNDNSTPLDGDRSLIITPLMEVTIVDALKGLFQQAAAIAEQYATGMMGRAAGYKWYMDQNCRTHTVGVQGGTPLVNGAAQTGASLITDGWTASITNVLRKGDIFTIANVNHVNPQSRQSTGQVQQFVVTAAGDSTAGGAFTVSIDPPITISGADQTVDAAPADNAALTVLGAASVASPTGVAWHRDCVTLASADLPVPTNVDMGARKSDEQLGFSIRVLRQYDISTDQWPTRADVLYGSKLLRSELGCRVQG